jgi:hypothetical protein
LYLFQSSVARASLDIGKADLFHRALKRNKLYEPFTIASLYRRNRRTKSASC